jgi:hypothetical protein
VGELDGLQVGAEEGATEGAADGTPNANVGSTVGKTDGYMVGENVTVVHWTWAEASVVIPTGHGRHGTLPGNFKGKQKVRVSMIILMQYND